jgi:hypothetical protein
MAKAVRKKAEESEGLKIGANPLPISFKEFSKNPVVGMLFLCICGISYLYIDNAKSNEKQDEKIGALYEMVRKSDSSNAASTARLEMAVDLKALKKFK